MFLELTDYQEELRALSGAIKSLLDVDVIIVDRWLTQLVNTFHYSREPLDIRVNSIVGNVIVTGEVQIVPNRRDNRSCMSCPDYSLCELDSVVGVPLKSGEDCVGALLVMFSIRRSVLLENQAEQLVTFLSRLGALIVRMMEADRLGIQVDRLQQNTEGLLDQLADAVAVTGEDGRILFANHHFCRIFDFTPEALFGEPLSDVLRPFLMSPDGTALRSGVYLTGHEDVPIQLLSSAPVSMLHHENAHLFLFREVDLPRAMNVWLPPQADEKLNAFWGVSPQMCAARLAAVTATRNNLHVLIEGNCREQNLELIHLLCRMNTEAQTPPVIVDCSMAPKYLEQTLFGDGASPALLSPLCCGTLCLTQINHMPFYLQKKLHAFLCDRAAGKTGHNKLRIFASSDEDLSKLCREGRFLEELLSFLLKNHIVIPRIEDAPEDVTVYFERFVQEFARIYEKGSVSIAPAVSKTLLDSGLPLDYVSLRELAEYQVRTLEGDTLEQLLPFPDQFVQEPVTGRRDLLEEQIRRLVRQGCQKTEIAAQVGISRATLYRKLKKYNLTAD